MRPLVKLMGRGEVHLDGSLADVKLTRKLWYVLALVAIAPDAEMLRTELTALAWPLSDERSRDVLMHKWRKSVVDAFSELGVSPVIVISERFVNFDTTLVTIDYIECLRIGKTLLSSHNAAATLEAAIEFDTLASDQILLSGYPEAFETQRTDFDSLRIQCLERGWKAAVTCGNNEAATQFADRLRKLGYTGDLYIEADAEEFGIGRETKPRNYAQGIAALLIVGLLSAPIILGRVSQPPTAQRTSGSLFPDQTPTYIGRFIQYEYKPKPEDLVTSSEAVATIQVPGRGTVTTGVVRHKNLDQQILTVCTTANRKRLWSTLTPQIQGVQYFPDHITSDKFGNVFVGAHVNVMIRESAGRAPGRYLALLKYGPDGKLLSTSISKYPQDRILHLIRVVSDMEGGAWLFSTGYKNSNSVSILRMHLRASGALDDALPTGKGIAELTAVVQGAQGENYLISTVYKGKNPLNASDWQVQRISKDGKLEWTRTIDGPAHRNDFFSDATLATNGDVLVFGPLATVTFDGVIRNIPSVIRMDAGNGRIKKLEQTQTHFLNTRVMLSPVPMLDMYVLGSYDMTENGSNSVYFYRSRPAEEFSSLSMVVGLPKKMKAKRIVSMYYRGSLASFSALMQPLESPGQRLALIYVNKYSGTDITTGILTTDRLVHYNQSDANIVAGRFGKNFTVFDFTGLK
ncbi:MAG: hypothetical protein ACOYLC_11980 [Armatimonadaceae bacterium]